MTSNAQFPINTIVAYSVDFLRSIGAQTGELPQRRGIVAGFKIVGGRDFALVVWHNPQGAPGAPELVNSGCLAKPGPNSRFCSC